MTVTNTRTIYHPVQRDSATYIRTAAETGGECTLLVLEVEPGGGNQLHRHKTYTERFTVLDGVLGVEAAGKQQLLRTGESLLVPIGGAHRFFSASESRTRFQVELRPGHAGFEQALRIGYGLAGDGLVNAAGIPKRILDIAVLLELSDMGFVGPMALLEPLFRLLAKLARRRGVLQALLARYCAT
ncbi:MAG: cupin domain-containing protein [Roseiflexaceae bacterium]|nr:cupin domain-containing protein [Roseiflexaceae bacterium]